jgi:hypothetical protein
MLVKFTTLVILNFTTEAFDFTRIVVSKHFHSVSIVRVEELYRVAGIRTPIIVSFEMRVFSNIVSIMILAAHFLTFVAPFFQVFGYAKSIMVRVEDLFLYCGF